jgi:arabinoxylan arabinofuranohydrolase
MNPILPLQHFVPDVEARVWQDGRIYLYGSYDISGDTVYCSHEYHVFSSTDLVHWEHHGESFRSNGPNSGVPWAEAPLYAPDCIFYNGRYYLFFCLSDKSEGVAESLSPSGPFTKAAPIQGANGDGIDPAVLVDDDGQVYYYWGQFQLRGARLNPDLCSIDAASLQTALITEAEHGFHEGASIRKHNGIYYLVYTDISRGRATSMSYATSPSPLGPFVKGGILIDNTGCDPETWNNHGSIAEFNGQWYIFYHRSSQASRFNRRVCAEPIHFNPDGSIAEVEMTTQGVSAPLQGRATIEAWRACLLSGQVRTAALGPDEHYLAVCEHLTLIHDGDWAAYKYIEFGAGVSTFQAQAASRTDGGVIEIHLDRPDGPLAGSCTIQRTGGWQKWGTFTCRVQNFTGIRAVYLVFRGRPGRLFDLDSFRFTGSDAPG